ncbi:hypothetical protein BY996DRAFT_1277444 [Phakopsora pachyrhizi]|uniref:Uncharacterized protein n=1 Tax=Phakopsora pachyrhizi TaxID=170000 RepID=A0AAV0B6U8_PHAPC|nr:hypothetical protein BY996DRAFT_1277444 [Phakopsora pachyrhizi]CAH7681607.1 hypothetical protein PPACK8108_LOCUS14226 [Phakopsora pachyrhizi]
MQEIDCRTCWSCGYFHHSWNSNARFSKLIACAGSLLVGAGIVPVPVELCESSRQKHMSTATRAFKILDDVKHGFSSNFGRFNQADGLKVYVVCIKVEVEIAMFQCSTHGSSVLKSSELHIQNFT